MKKLSIALSIAFTLLVFFASCGHKPSEAVMKNNIIDYYKNPPGNGRLLGHDLGLPDKSQTQVFKNVSPSKVEIISTKESEDGKSVIVSYKIDGTADEYTIFGYNPDNDVLKTKGVSFSTEGKLRLNKDEFGDWKH